MSKEQLSHPPYWGTFHQQIQQWLKNMPNTDVKSRVAPVMKRDSYPAPDYPFAYQQAALSGNIINGLGEHDFRPAEKVFHTGDYTSPWGGMEFYFHLDDSIPVFVKFLQTEWNNRHHDEKGTSIR